MPYRAVCVAERRKARRVLRWVRKAREQEEDEWGEKGWLRKWVERNLGFRLACRELHEAGKYRM